ncbi:MAG: hypothetical protein JWR38_1633 [Mucilaginibacter sp.]|nr:hypothetical protein [Mucilaginibacter sp.]
MIKKLILISIFFSYISCKSPVKNVSTTAIIQKDSVKELIPDTNRKAAIKKDDKSKLTCDSLLILLIKTSSIDQKILAVGEKMSIDSVKNKVISINISHANEETGDSHTLDYLELDLNKLELWDVIPDEPKPLTFDHQLLNYILKKQCYLNDVDYVTAPDSLR